jgi:hypothetical protein
LGYLGNALMICATPHLSGTGRMRSHTASGRPSASARDGRMVASDHAALETRLPRVRRRSGGQLDAARELGRGPAVLAEMEQDLLFVLSKLDFRI